MWLQIRRQRNDEERARFAAALRLTYVSAGLGRYPS